MAQDLVPLLPRLLVARPADAPRRWRAEGTMAFIDISGFTSLSEQLARRGRVGAEDLVSTLTRIFTLLMSVTEDGGDVVKFAGDALLVLYDGPDHERHACHAMAAAQRLMAVVGSVRLAGARARLRMSVGVHTGSFDIVLTGRETQNLVVGGPALDTVLDLERRAGPGQVLVSTDVADALPRSARGPEVDGAVLLRRVPGTESASGGALPVLAEEALLPYLPVVFRHRPDLLAADSDHRRAAMGFLQVSGLNALLASEPEPVLDALTDRVEAACAAAGVTLLDTDIATDGFRYFLTAGAPAAVEDPEGRLLRALVEVLGDRRVAPELTLRAGATVGQVFAGLVGAPFRRTYSVMGDPTNLAARLGARAPDGAVLAQEALVSRSASTFATASHPPVSVKGKAEPVAVCVVERLVGRRGRPDAHLQFVGREEELALLGDRIAASAAVEVIGEAGLGKTRLAQHAADSSGRRVIRISADPYGEHVAFRTLGRLVAPLLGVQDGDGPDRAVVRLRGVVLERDPGLEKWLPLLAPLVDAELPATVEVAELDDRFRAARLHDAVRRLLTALLDQPTVVIVDDAQWVDPTSADALAAAFGGDDPPAALVLTRRDEQRGLRGGATLPTTEVRLGPLPDRTAQALVAAASATALRRGQVEAMVARATGNPYFLIELARAPADVLPDTVEELVGLRIDELSGRARDLLRQAAVLGSRFPVELLLETTGATDVAGLAADLDGFVVIAPDGTCRFGREVQREVAYQQLTFRRRRDLHGRAVRAIERHPGLGSAARLPLLSLHAYASGAWTQAFAYSRAAAEEAQQSFANEEAAVFCRRAIEAGGRSGEGSRGELAELQVILGDVLTRTGRHEEAAHAYRSARRAWGHGLRAAEVTYKLGMVHRESGHFAAALAAAGRVHALAAEIPAPRGLELSAEADLLRAGVRYWQGRCGDCRELATSVVARTEGLPPGIERTRLLARAQSLHDTAMIELEGRAGAYGDQPLGMFREIGDLYNEGRFAVNLAVGEYYEGRWGRAVEMYQLSLEIAERIGDVFSVAVAKMNIGEVLSLQGDTAGAVALLEASVAELRALDTPLAAAHAALYLSVAHRLAGRLAEARARLEESTALFVAAGRDRGFGLDDLASRRAELLVEEGRPDEAVADATTTLQRPEPLADLHRARLLRARASARMDLGLPELARDDLQDSIRLAGELPLGYEAALGLALRATWDADAAAHAEATRRLAALGARAEVLVGQRRATR